MSSSHGIRCAKCGAVMGVIDSRPIQGGVRRRHRCAQCGHRDTSYQYLRSELTRRAPTPKPVFLRVSVQEGSFIVEGHGTVPILD